MADLLGLDEAQSPLLSILQQVVFEDNFLRKIKAVDILISALEKDTAKSIRILVEVQEDGKIVKKKVDAYGFRRYIHQEVLSNDKFRRKVELFARVTDHVETGIEYFGADFITHPEFIYNAEFMSKLAKIERVMHHFVGKLIKEYSKGEEVEF